MLKEQLLQMGARFQAAREQQNFSRAQVSEIVGVSALYIGEIERGIKCPSLDLFYDLCQLLNVSTEYILKGKDKPTDVSSVIACLEMLDDEHVEYAEDIVMSYVKAVTVSEMKLINKEKHQDTSG